MKAEQFGSQFFMGTIVKQHPEYPLHFMQGLWGSAFSILIHRVLDPKQTRKKSKDQDDIEKEMHEIMDEQSTDGICEGDQEEHPSFKSRGNLLKRSINSLIDAGKSMSKWMSSSSSMRSLPPPG